MKIHTNKGHPWPTLSDLAGQPGFPSQVRSGDKAGSVQQWGQFTGEWGSDTTYTHTGCYLYYRDGK